MKTIISLSIITLLLAGCANKNEGMPASAPATLPVLNIAYESAATETEFPVAIQGKNPRSRANPFAWFYNLKY